MGSSAGVCAGRKGGVSGWNQVSVHGLRDEREKESHFLLFVRHSGHAGLRNQVRWCTNEA